MGAGRLKTGRSKLFSLTKKDFKFEYFRCSGKGGQKVNKTSSGVRIRHYASGAFEASTRYREQSKNKKEAFRKLTNNKIFKAWLHLEILRKNGVLDQIELEVEKSMQEIKVEVLEGGRWVEWLII